MNETVISLETEIRAPIEICFDLSRSIELHQLSTKQTNEIAIDGRTTGLIEKGEFVTWEATHFMIRQHLTVAITEMERPFYFKDVMLKGAFKTMEHVHKLKSDNGRTLLIDEFVYTVPFGFIGALFNWVILRKYMKSLLTRRNALIKAIAESETIPKLLMYA
ncbi:SRPBCC family protein [Chryseosolibacter indicus]|uniref:SRPBCC family protein n=1 Tax=Chryseosolibacter indicus TaxID=2782351 RepID=A0ABS5VNR4_9BACT|nr:SRPBCC family protein [Chryseosolibacter indicus]MBT1703063.1 SRPBCC family protein [Chryseosolibacter indicus]